MGDIWTMGELLVEIMRPKEGMSLHETGPFVGPFPSGAPGIFIDTVARLGHSATIISGIGDDDFGRCILDRFKTDGVRTDFVEVFPHRSTGVAFVTYFRDGSRRFIFHWDGTPAVMARVPDPQNIQSPAYLHIMGCSLMANDGFREEVFQAVELFVRKGAKISFDPNIRFELLGKRSAHDIVGPILRHCSLFFPGERELRMLSGKEDLGAGVQDLRSRYPLDIVVVKKGKRGYTVYSKDTTVDVPAFAVKEVDPTGAGDCFDAGFLCGQLEGAGPEESARLASAVGALNAQAFGPMEGAINREAVGRLLVT